MNDEVRDALLRLQEAMSRMHIRVAAMEAATVLLLRTNAGNANVADEFERSIRRYLQGMDQHRDHVFAFEEMPNAKVMLVVMANASISFLEMFKFLNQFIRLDHARNGATWDTECSFWFSVESHPSHTKTCFNDLP